MRPPAVVMVEPKPNDNSGNGTGDDSVCGGGGFRQ